MSETSTRIHSLAEEAVRECQASCQRMQLFSMEDALRQPASPSFEVASPPDSPFADSPVNAPVVAGASEA